MGSPPRNSFCLSCAWSGTTRIGTCEQCGSQQLADLSRGALIRLPAGYQACTGCETADEPLVFRGSIRLWSAVFVARETRRAGYLCERCARRQTAASLAYTGLIGWWGVTSLVFYAPRATYYNWRAVWRPPSRPLAWGALDASALAEELQAKRRDSWATEEAAAL